MTRSPVSNSSNVRAIGYDRKHRALEIEFHNGAVYQYFDVPEDVYLGLLNASSVGGYLAAEVKGYYRYSRV